jgi:hypothetical protein
MAKKRGTEISVELLEELGRRAEQRGLSPSELLEEIVRAYLDNTDSLKWWGELFERVDRRQREQGVQLLSEEEAMGLANEELHALRRERAN